MASLVSQISLANRSLAALGSQASVSSINPSDNTTAGDACSLLFIPTFEQLARASWWNCLRAQKVLTLVAAATGTPGSPQGATLPQPPYPWKYGYLYPSDCLKARMIVPSPQNSAGASIFPNNLGTYQASFIRGAGQIPFEVYYGTDPQSNPITLVVTNQCRAQLMYTVDQPNPVIWDTQFQAAFVASLAAFLVPTLTLHMGLMQGQIALAERIIMAARASDGNEGFNTQDREAEWIRARSGGPGCGTGWGGVGYDSVAWPC